MRKIYSFFVLCSVSFTVAGQEIKELIIHGNQYKSSETPTNKKHLIPVKASDILTIYTDIFFRQQIRRPGLANLIKAVGVGMATYQVSNYVYRKDGSPASSNTLVPLGIGTFLTADRLAAKKKPPVYLKYTWYDKNMTSLSVDMRKIDPQKSKGEERQSISLTVPADGFVELSVFNLPAEHNSDLHLTVKSASPSDNNDEETPPLFYMPRPRLMMEPIATDRLVVPAAPGHVDDFIVNLRPAQGVVVPLPPTAKLSEDPENAANNDHIPVKYFPVIGSKINTPAQTLPATPNPGSGRRKNMPLIPPFTVTPGYLFLGKRKKNEEEDEFEEDEFEEDEFEEHYPKVARYEVPGMNGVGSGSGGDATVVWHPTPPGVAWTGTYSSSNGDQSLSAYGNDGESPGWAETCDPYDPWSTCYTPCIEADDVTAAGQKVDPQLFNKFILDHNLIPPGAINPIVRLNIDDSNGKIQYKISVAYSDALGNITVNAPMNIGPAIDNYATSSFNTMSAPGPWETSGSFPIVGGSVENYSNPGTGDIYALFTDSITGVMTCFPGIIIVPDTPFTAMGSAATFPPGFVLLSTVGNGITTLQHEYGHYLQYKLFGWDTYFDIALASVFSAAYNPSNHHNVWTETSANTLSSFFFGPNAEINSTQGQTDFPKTACQ